MDKILYIHKGLKYIVEVGEGGGVSAEVETIWNEKKDGTCPEKLYLEFKQSEDERFAEKQKKESEEHDLYASDCKLKEKLISIGGLDAEEIQTAISLLLRRMS